MTDKRAPLPRTAIYVISLENSSDRKGVFEAHARASGTSIPWSYHRAHTQLSSDLSYDARDAMIARGRALYPAELGVYSSHHSAWLRLLQEDADQVLIMEDDVVIDWDFVDTLLGCDLEEIGIRYLKLFNKNIMPFQIVSHEFYRRTLVNFRGFAHGMQAYMVTRAGAQVFVEFCRSVRRPIDDELDRSWAHGIPNLAVFPFPAFERHVPSTIGTTRYKQHRLPSNLVLPRFQMQMLEKLRRTRQRLGRYGYQSPLSSAQGLAR